MLALIDADFLLYSCTHNKKDAEIKTLEEVLYSADEHINQILDTLKANEFLLFLTSRLNFRKSLYQEYKANRKAFVKPNYFYELRDHLIDKYGAIEVNEYEADDLVEIYRNYYQKDKKVTVVSADKDVLNLIGFNYNPVKHLKFEISKEVADLYFWGSMITGDQTDNIKGIEGRGPAYSKNLLKEYSESLSSIILEQYIKNYGEYIGIQYFYKNYILLKILDKPLQGDIEFSFIEPRTINNKINEFEF